MPIAWRNKILLIKTETVYGTDPVPTGAVNAVLGIDVKVMPMEGDDASRELDLPYLASIPTIPKELHAKISFKVEMAPSGALGVAPAWGPVLRACAVAQTISAGVSVTYNPISVAHESATIYLYIGDTLYKIRGARGTCVMRLDAQGIPYLEFDLTGLFTTPAEGVRPTPVLTGFQKPLLATSANTPTFTINGVAQVMRKFALDLGNAVENRFLVGAEAILITDRSEMIETTVEAVPLTTLNPFALAAAQTTMVVNIAHGTVAGARAAINVPLALMQRPKGVEGQQNIKEWPLSLIPQANLGNDQWTLVLT